MPCTAAPRRRPRRVIRRLAVAAAIGAAPAAAPAAASAASGAGSGLAGAGSTFTSYPGLAARLIDNSILPLPADGATIAGVQNVLDWATFGMSMNMPLVRARFSLRAGALDELQNTGGVRFVNWSAPLATVSVSSFDVVWVQGPTPRGWLSAEIDNDPARRITLFDLDFAHATQQVVGGRVVISDIQLVLTALGQSTLAGALHTDAFVVGETCGSFAAGFPLASADGT